jgi:hypothetical protein
MLCHLPTRRLLLALVLTALFGVLPARAQIDAATAESLVRRSGLWDAMANLAPQVRAGMIQSLVQSPRPPSAEAQERIGRVVDAAFAAAPLRATCIAVIAEKTPPEAVAPLQAWLESPLGRRLTAIEVAASASTVPPEEAARAGAAAYQAATPARQALIDDHVRTTQAAELMHEAMIVTALAVARGVAAASPELPRPSLNELERFLRGQKAQAMPGMTMFMTAGTASTYAQVPDADLSEYLVFLKTEPALRFNDAASQALIRAIAEAGEAMGRNLRSASDAARS